MERIYVAVRARPLSAEESETSPWKISGNSIFLTNQQSKFEFDRVFREDCQTVEIFEARTKEIVASVVRGFNGTVFAYGQTSSGKTYTMRGSTSEPGIIPLSVHELFCRIQEVVDREFLLRMSYMEIYNEDINDLLTPGHRKLQIHESLERGIYVTGLKEEIVSSPEQVLKLVEYGESHRHIGETNMNLYSSRSHTIFRMIVESRDRSVGDDSFTCLDAVRVSALSLVDLAGSERAGKTGAEGLRLKEGSHINKSLMTLGTVIKKLSDGAESLGGHVPYRDSKLTRILQPALGGNANTAMICNITLSQIHADETKSTLLFASRALQVKNCACVNEILTDAALLKRQKKEIEVLRAKLLNSHSEHLEEEILNLRNTLLQSELEKERIALELEEEKKAKAYRDRRLLEQEKKIENLSSLILYSERDDKAIQSMQRKRRLTWCPGPFGKIPSNELSNPEAVIVESLEDETGKSLLHPFDKVIQEIEDHVDVLSFGGCTSDEADHTDMFKTFTLPDRHDLLYVTTRKKNHGSGNSLTWEGKQPVEEDIKFADIYFDNEDKEDISIASTEARAASEHLIFFSNQNIEEVSNGGDTALKISLSIEEIASHFNLVRKLYDSAFVLSGECLQFFSIISEIIEEFKLLPRFCMVQMNSIISGHKSILINMVKKLKDVELEKDMLSNQLYDHQKQILQLKSELENSESTTAEQSLCHDMEKDELLSQVFYLQKEVSQLSSSSLVRERDTLRKELDKCKSKLKDTDCKLKNIIHEKVKLEGEKAQAEREIKSLLAQRALLERDILKRDSYIEKRREVKFLDQEGLQDDYDKLEVLSFEMAAEISYLKEALKIAFDENDNAFMKNDTLTSDIETLTKKLNAAYSEMELIKEDHGKMKQMVADTESFSRRLENSLDLLSKEKEVMMLELTDALLEVEVEKLGWISKEKTLNRKLERSNNEIVELSKILSEVMEELQLNKVQCNSFKERLGQSDGINTRENDFSISKSPLVDQLKADLRRLSFDTNRIKDENYESELVSLDSHPRVIGVKDNLFPKVDIDALEEKYNELKSNSELVFEELNQRISSLEVQMQEDARREDKESKVLRRKLKEALDERKAMDAKYLEASTMLKGHIRSYGQQILKLTRQLAEKK